MKPILSALLPATWLAAFLALQTGHTADLPLLNIDHLAADGQLTFAPVAGYTSYTIEWAPTVNGPWSDNWLGLRAIAPQAQSHTVAVPMFYRVVARGTPVIVPAGLAYIPFGTFMMGDTFGLAAEATPVHLVEVNAFLIERREVTQALWDQVAVWGVARGYQFSGPYSATPADHPVNDIEWFDAIKWCNARSEMEGLDPVYFTDNTLTTVYRAGMLDLANDCVKPAANGYRLPTEAEWERAARGSASGHHYAWESPGGVSEDLIRGDHANYWNSGDPFDNGTTPAGFYNGAQSIGGEDMANGFGLYDIAGNVAELCWDRYGAYSSLPQLDPRGPESGSLRVRRGGSWYDNVARLRCASRQSIDPGHAGVTIGFRCVRKPE